MSDIPSLSGNANTQTTATLPDLPVEHDLPTSVGAAAEAQASAGADGASVDVEGVLDSANAHAQVDASAEAGFSLPNVLGDLGGALLDLCALLHGVLPF